LYLDGEFLSVDAARLPAASRALAYGDGCFETLKALNGRFLALEAHLERLKRGADHLGIQLPEPSGTIHFAHVIHELLDRNELVEKTARIRLQVWRRGPLGYSTPALSPGSVMITASEFSNKPITRSLGSVAVRRIPDAALPASLKLSNGLNYILAQREAAVAGFDEALMYDLRDHISETSMANVFWYCEGALETPASSCDLLPGITRSLVIRAMADRYPIREVEAPKVRILQAECVFTCNSLREWEPVHRVDHCEYPMTHPVIATTLTHWYDFRNDALE
jgi:branched-subunit amino acid aminotransferase/4-amino-4-deoxychorismate lyase